MVKFSLHTYLRGLGKMTIEGREYQDTIIFDHPKEEGEIVLQVKKERASEIASMDRHTQNRMNLRIEKYEVYEVRIGRGVEHYRDGLETFLCPHCQEVVTKVAEDFLLHSIPSCDAWKKEHP